MSSICSITGAPCHDFCKGKFYHLKWENYTKYIHVLNRVQNSSNYTIEKIVFNEGRMITTGKVKTVESYDIERWDLIGEITEDAFNRLLTRELL